MPEFNKNKSKNNNRTSTIDIIRDYPEKTGQHLEGSTLLRDTVSPRMYNMWIYYKKVVNQLYMEEKRHYYLLIKKKWLRDQAYWADERKIAGYGKMGINIPLAAYDYIALRKDNSSELVLCIIDDGGSNINKDFTYYSTTFCDMEKFARRHYTIHIEPWGDEVIGLPYAIFNRI